jgi:hypothetical protein
VNSAANARYSVRSDTGAAPDHPETNSSATATPATVVPPASTTALAR